MKSLLSLSLVALGALALVPEAHASFLVDPIGGTSLSGFVGFVGSDLDDGSQLRSLGGAFSLYGASYSSIYVQVGGFLSVADGGGFVADRSVGVLASAVPGPVISPFYDDFYLDPALGDSITENVTSSYYAISYAIAGYFDFTAGHQSNFQAALIKSATNLRGNALRAGDIVLSYGELNSTVQIDNFSVGVGASESNATNAFDAPGGQFTTTASFLSNFDAANQALLFRYDPASGRYAQSLITYQAVPEPSSLAALGLVGAAALRRRLSPRASRPL